MPVASVTLTDGQVVKLGRIPPLRQTVIGQYLVQDLPDGTRKVALRLDPYHELGTVAPPASVDYAAKAMDSIRRKYLNDQYGDCVIAGKAHQIGLYTGNDMGTAAQVADSDVLAAYHRICGPGDNGCNISEVLDVFRSSGLWGHKIDDYVAVDNSNKLQVQVAIDVFGSLTLGIDLPSGWTCTNCVWDDRSGGNVGGHDICTVGYNDQGVQCATWGGIVTITWPAFQSKRWITETWANLSPDWYGSDKLAPNGINADALKADLAILKQGGIPPLVDQLVDNYW